MSDNVSFTFTNDEGNVVQEVWTCTECTYISLKKHFRSSESNPACPMCRSPATKERMVEQSAGMSDFKYRQLRQQLNEAADGVGSATIANIEQHFEDGDDFLDATERAYRKMEYDGLMAVDGVGQSSAKSIALTIAAHEGWENGAIFAMGR